MREFGNKKIRAFRSPLNFGHWNWSPFWQTPTNSIEWPWPQSPLFGPCANSKSCPHPLQIAHTRTQRTPSAFLIHSATQQSPPPCSAKISSTSIYKSCSSSIAVSSSITKSSADSCPTPQSTALQSPYSSSAANDSSAGGPFSCTKR